MKFLHRGDIYSVDCKAYLNSTQLSFQFRQNKFITKDLRHQKTGYCNLPLPPPTPPMSQESLNLTPESSNSAENDSFLNSTAETSLTLSQKMTLPRPTMGLAATCLRRLPIED